MNNQAIARVESGQISTNAGEIDIFRLGEVFARSGYFTDAKDASQAIVKILAGREIGIGAMASMTGFHIVQGKPTLSANLITSIIKNKASGYNYRVTELTEKACEIEFFEKGEPIGASRFTIEQAKEAGLTGKEVWKKFPQNMLFARAISNGAKWFCPDVFNGATVYTPEELGANVDADGAIIPDITAAPAPAPKVRHINQPPTGETEELIFGQDLPALEVPADDPAPEKSILKARALIKELLESIGVNPAASLKKYDSLKTDKERGLALAKVRELYAKEKSKEAPPGITQREANIDTIKDALKRQGWDKKEQFDYLSKWFIDAENNLENQSEETINSILADLQTHRML